MYKEVYKNWEIEITPTPNDISTITMIVKNNELDLRYYNTRKIYQNEITQYTMYVGNFSQVAYGNPDTRRTFLTGETIQDAIKDLKGMVDFFYLCEKNLKKNVKQYDIKISYGEYKEE